MDLNTAKKILTHYMEIDDGFDKVDIQFFGGEPMLAFNRIKEIVDWFHSIKWKKEYLFDICTNGTILTEDMKNWLINNRDRVVVGFSLDGNRISHNITRSNSYDELKINLPFFLKNWPNQFAKMTISAENMPYVADSIIELEETEIPFTANVVFENIWGRTRKKRKLLDIYENELSRLVDYYAIHSDFFPATIVDRQIEYIYDPDQTKGSGNGSPRFCGAGHEMLEIDVDGSISPCHRFSSWVTRKPALSSLANRQKEWKPRKCAECKLIPICPTCTGYNWEVNNDSGMRTTYHCEAFKLEVSATAKLQAIRLSKKDLSGTCEISPGEAYRMRNKLDAIMYLIKNGV